MNFDLRISFEIEEGLYTLALSEYQPNADIPIAVVEIVLELEKQPLSPNPLKVFSYVISKIEEYIAEREVILYYYCDRGGLYYRNNNKRRFLSPQHFRSTLFHTLFTKVNPKDLLISNRIIPNIHIGNHYISFIYKQKHQPYVDTLTKELEEYQNK
nr:hypothetical protein [uncultured Capnocytophaga sp.]